MFDELQHLILVHETGSFTVAARRAHLSQPALSMSVARLEQAMDARLVDRTRGQIGLTAEGQALLPHARAALAAVETGRAAVAALAGLLAGEVRIAAGATAATYLLPATLARFRAAAPGVRLRLREATTRATLSLLAAHEVDLGVVVEGARLPRGVVAEPFADDTLVVVRAADSDEATALPWVAFPPGTPTRAALDAHEAEAEIAVEASEIAAIVAACAAGMGRALVPEVAVAAALAAGRLVRAPTPWSPLQRRLMLVHRGVEALSPAAAALRQAMITAAGPKQPHGTPLDSAVAETAATEPTDRA
ncbi:MAG: LysR family transcriptional regulator [Deltaproteobacteria bacterium]|nr:LysR family transcriptional regulator [Deltaproteobacteria bacterium]